MKDNTTDSRKKTVKQRTIFQEEMSEFLSDSKNTVTMSTLNEFSRHGGSAVNGIHLPQVGQKRLWQRKGTNFR